MTSGMTNRSLMAAGLLGSCLVLCAHSSSARDRAPAEPTPTSGRVSFSSRISEVDACNQAQYQTPAGSAILGFRLGASRDKEGNLFHCSVSWSSDSKAEPANRPLPFPNPVSIPLIWSGWL
jgi:hypothetical protein